MPFVPAFKFANIFQQLSFSVIPFVYEITPLFLFLVFSHCSAVIMLHLMILVFTVFKNIFLF